ncbi:MAG: hypothetical protein LUH23_05380 [Oscillospiraceae bacterium]|nr:hypothetical protein [Oscillospiraceae bacterium]
MLTYLVALALGIIGVYKLREGLLIIQNYNDEKEAQLMRAQIEPDNNIISKNSEQCKTFKQAS